jgi:AraC family transcriptional regulator
VKERDVSVNLNAHGEWKYPETTVLLSSEGRRWSGVAAELRAHPACELPAVVPQQTEVIIAIRGCCDGWVRRTGAGERQHSAGSIRC